MKHNYIASVITNHMVILNLYVELDDQWIQPVPANLKCQMCSCVAIDPHRDSHCNTLFCEECASKLHSHHSLCPICQTKFHASYDPESKLIHVMTYLKLKWSTCILNFFIVVYCV